MTKEKYRLANSFSDKEINDIKLFLDILRGDSDKKFRTKDIVLIFKGLSIKIDDGEERIHISEESCDLLEDLMCSSEVFKNMNEDVDFFIHELNNSVQVEEIGQNCGTKVFFNLPSAVNTNRDFSKLFLIIASFVARAEQEGVLISVSTKTDTKLYEVINENFDGWSVGRKWVNSNTDNELFIAFKDFNYEV